VFGVGPVFRLLSDYQSKAPGRIWYRSGWPPPNMCTGEEDAELADLRAVTHQAGLTLDPH